MICINLCEMFQYSYTGFLFNNPSSMNYIQVQNIEHVHQNQPILKF